MSKPEELQICLPTIFSQNYNPSTTEEKDYWNIVPSKNKYQSLDLQLMNKSKNILGIKRKRKKKDSQTKLDTNLAFFGTLPFSKSKQESLHNQIKNGSKKKPFLDIKHNQNIYKDPYLFNGNLLGEIKSISSINENNISEPNLSNSFDNEDIPMNFLNNSLDLGTPPIKIINNVLNIDYNNSQNLNSSQRLRKSDNFPLGIFLSSTSSSSG